MDAPECGKGGRLAGTVAVVTGGTGGIGRAVCRALAREAASLAVVDLLASPIEAFIAQLERDFGPGVGPPPAIGMALDVRKERDMEEMAGRTLERFGRIDLLVHCAGILRGKGCGPRFLYQVSTEEWDQVVETNLKGTFLCNRAVLPAMTEQRRGHIINFSSTSGLKGRAFDSVYCATKFGMIGLSEALSEEMRHYGVRVHVILPDAVKTPIWDQNGPVRAPERSLAPERVGDLVCYLALLPEDTALGNLVIAPFHFRKRKKGG